MGGRERGGGERGRSQALLSSSIPVPENRLWKTHTQTFWKGLWACVPQLGSGSSRSLWHVEPPVACPRVSLWWRCLARASLPPLSTLRSTGSAVWTTNATAPPLLATEAQQPCWFQKHNLRYSPSDDSSTPASTPRLLVLLSGACLADALRPGSRCPWVPDSHHRPPSLYQPTFPPHTSG